MKPYDLAVIGGGPGGLSAALYAGLRGISVVAFEAESFGGQLTNLYPTKPITNYPAEERIVSRELALRLAAQAGRFGAELRESEPVESVSEGPMGYVLKTKAGETVAPALVLALGLGRFTPRRLGLRDEERFAGKGVAYRLPPLEQIEARHIVVVGGGDAALDIALALRAVAPVTLVHRRDEFRACAYSQGLVRESGMDVILCGEVKELHGGERLESVLVQIDQDERQELPADLLVIAIGQAPDLGDLEHWSLNLHGPRLAVDTAMQTSRPGLYAVGDFASYPGKVKMIATAVAEGSTTAAAVERQLAAA